MAFPSVTNTFVNGATSDASAVNQNFTDLINGLSDTTKDFSMNNGTLSGTMTMNGNVVLGSSSSKTVNFLGSLISSVPVSANAAWDLGGSTLGFKSLWLGSSGSFTTKIIAGATANWVMTLPPTAGANLQVLTTDGSGVTSWQNLYNDPTARENYGISSSVGASALTINLLGANGSNPSATNPVNINFRNSTSATGTPSFVQVTGALSLTVPSGATLGTFNGTNAYLYLYAINNAGAVELGVAGNGVIDEGSTQNTTNISSGSSSSGVLYSTTGRTGVAVRLLGRLLVNEATAGTWASNSTEIASGTFSNGPCIWSGYHDSSNGNSWSRSSVTFGDFANADSSVALHQVNNVNFGTVTGYGATSGSSALPGLVITPPVIGRYWVKASFLINSNNATSQFIALRLMDVTDSVAIDSSGCVFAGGQVIATVTLGGVINFASTSSKTISIQGANSVSGTFFIDNIFRSSVLSGGSNIEWTIYLIR